MSKSANIANHDIVVCWFAALTRAHFTVSFVFVGIISVIDFPPSKCSLFGGTMIRDAIEVVSTGFPRSRRSHNSRPKLIWWKRAVLYARYGLVCRFSIKVET